MLRDYDSVVLSESPDAVILTTSEGTVVHWTKGAEAVFGYTSADEKNVGLRAVTYRDSFKRRR
jgi:PAS domain S-box-containing protein